MHRELTLKLRLALHKTPLPARDETTPSELRDAFRGAVQRMSEELLQGEPPETELFIGPLQTECTSRYLMVGLQTYFRIFTNRPVRARRIMQRLAVETEAGLRTAI